LVKALLTAMTKDDKYRFLQGVGWARHDNKKEYHIGNAAEYERFGIPPLNMDDNGQGFRTFDSHIVGKVTSWPCGLAIAATWSEVDTKRWAVALAEEFKVKGANVILGPGVNVHRVARGGRNAEYISGEAPYLGSRLAVPYVQGVQSKGVLAVVKHFVTNDQETNRNGVNSIVDSRSLWEVYYPPFQAAVDAGVAAVMCSYNSVNGRHACGNPDLLLTDLKDTMGFEGWVQSDWWALHSFAAPQGVDQEMPGIDGTDGKAVFTHRNLDVLDGAKIDDMVGRQLKMMLRHGLFEAANRVCEPPHCHEELYVHSATSPGHAALSAELATKSVLLLKNTGVLPLRIGVKTIALLGSAAMHPRTCAGS